MEAEIIQIIEWLRLKVREAKSQGWFLVFRNRFAVAAPGGTGFSSPSV